MNYEITSILNIAIAEKASDVHLHVGESPTLRINGNINQLEGPKLTDIDTKNFVEQILTESQKEKLYKEKEVDVILSFEECQKTRFRVNVCCANFGYEIVARIVSDSIIEIEGVGFPSVEAVKNILNLPRGLILVTGPTGCGKSTTIAAMIDWINRTQGKHIISIEDPIEYLHTHNKSIITQRELHKDTFSFEKALRSALRQDPDIILVGEMRDLETVAATISAAETGHLVLATLHTTGAARTVDRILDIFPDYSKNLVKTQLASNLVAVISQVMCKKKSGSGRVPGFEVMTRTDSIASLIRDNKTFRIQSELETGQQFGMIELDKHLFQLFKEGIISEDEAISKAQNPQNLFKLISEIEPVKPKKKGFFF